MVEKKITLAAGAEGTIAFTAAVSEFKVRNLGPGVVDIKLDTTVSVGLAHAYRINLGQEEIIRCQGCAVLHLISATADTIVTVAEISYFVPRLKATLVASTETILDFIERAGKWTLINFGPGDLWYALDEVATVGGANCWKIPASGSVESEEQVMALHVISSGTPYVEAIGERLRYQTD